EVFAQRKAEARGKADRIRLVRDVAGRKLLPIEDVEARGYTITQEVRIHEGELGTFGVLPVLHRNLPVQAAAEQIAFGDADFSHEPICSRIAASHRESAGRVLLDVDDENDPNGSRAGLG